MSPGVLLSGNHSPIQPHSLARPLSSSDPKLPVPSSGTFCRRPNRGWATSGSSANASQPLRTRLAMHRVPRNHLGPSPWVSRHRAEPGTHSTPPTVPVRPRPAFRPCWFSLVAEQLPSCCPLFHFGFPQILLEAVRVYPTTSDSSLRGSAPRTSLKALVLCP